MANLYLAETSVGRASFSKKNRREQGAAGCFECRALEVGQAAFDEVYARYGLRSEPAPGCTMVLTCVECGAPRNFDAHGLDTDMRKEFSNLRRMADRDTRLRREWSDELKRLWHDFSERYQARRIMLFGLVHLEASTASTQAVGEWLDVNAEEMVRVFSQPPLVEQQKLNGSN